MIRITTLLRMLLAACLWFGVTAPRASAEPPHGKAKPEKRERRARSKKPARRHEEKRSTSRRARPRDEKPGDDQARDEKPVHPERETASKRAQESAQSAAHDATQGVDAQIVKDGDTSVKVMNFSGLDIEGRLKSPQLLYFVNRVQAEFERPKLPHRSFMPELERSTHRDPFP